MRRTFTWLVLLSAGIVVTILHTGNALATTSVGFVSTTLAAGRFGEIDVSNLFIPPNARQELRKSGTWLSWQETKGLSDLHIQSNVWEPGGHTGWHTHPGQSLVIVTAGIVTAYERDDPECKPRVYKQGMAFVDPGSDHVHILRNEGIVEARTIAVQFIPAGAMRRIDAPDPGKCRF